MVSVEWSLCLLVFDCLLWFQMLILWQQWWGAVLWTLGLCWMKHLSATCSDLIASKKDDINSDEEVGRTQKCDSKSLEKKGDRGLQWTLSLPKDSRVLLFDTSLLHHPHQTAQTFIFRPNEELWWIEHRPWSVLTAHECGMTGWLLVCGPGVA